MNLALVIAGVLVINRIGCCSYSERRFASQNALKRAHKSTPLLEETNRQNDDYYQYGNLNPIC